MDAKKYAYAAVGAPVSVAKAALDQFQEMVEKLNDATAEMRNMATKQIDGWAVEGEKMVKRVGDTKTIDEIASKVDFESVQEQVHKLRDQLEDLMATWRSNFKPAGKPEAPKAEAPAPKPAAKPAAKKPAAKKPAAKTTTAKKPAAKPATKKPAAKTTAAKKPAAKTTATKAS